MNGYKFWLVGVIGAGLVITACSSKSDNFVKNCTATIMEEGLGELAAKGACECASERLGKTLDGKQMSLATKLIGMRSSEANKLASEMPDGEEVMEAIDSAIKSCM